jgi:hypothetical protein
VWFAVNRITTESLRSLLIAVHPGNMKRVCHTSDQAKGPESDASTSKAHPSLAPP